MGFKFIRIGRWQPIRMRFNWRTTLIILILLGLIFMLGKKCDWISPIIPSFKEVIKIAICAIIMASFRRMLPRRQHMIATILSFAMSVVFMTFGIVGVLQDGNIEESESVCLVVGGLLFLLGSFCAWRWRRHYNMIVERKATIEMISARRKRFGL